MSDETRYADLVCKVGLLAHGDPAKVDRAKVAAEICEGLAAYERERETRAANPAAADGAITLLASMKPKWSALVRTLNDPATAEGAAALLDIGCYEDDVMAALDVLPPEDRRRIKDGAEAARAVVRAAGGSFGAGAKAAENALREGVGMALRGFAA